MVSNRIYSNLLKAKAGRFGYPTIFRACADPLSSCSAGCRGARSRRN